MSEAPDTKPEGMFESFQKAVASVESNPVQAVATLTALQHDVASKALFSTNETVDDITTRSLSLLTLEHYLAVAYSRLPASIDNMASRQQHVVTAGTLWGAFLQRLDQLDLLDAAEQEQYRDLMELSDNMTLDNDDGALPVALPPANRDVKIARFRAQQEAQQEQQHLQSLLARRGRLGIAADEEMDGHDEESLERTGALATIKMCKSAALEEWSSSIRELPMIARMVQSQVERAGRERHTGKAEAEDGRAPPLSGKPLQLTHITQNAGTGQLSIRKEEIQSKVFRAGWNQPTMSLEELAEREVADAMDRAEKQDAAEAHQKEQPRKYEQLLKDGMEDNKDLLDASAALDRQWDRFRDENPRGSGNKRGDVGDRNF